MKKRLKNTLGTLFLVLAVAATQIPATDVEAVSSSTSDFQLNGSMLVKYIGEETAVSVPDSVKEIGPNAFSGDADLYAVYLPEGLSKIDSGAFSNCPVLTVVDYPESLKEIDNFAFSNCDSLQDVTLGKNLTKLGYGVYAGCDALSDIQVQRDNPAFSDEGGILYNKDKTAVIQALAGSDFSKLNLPTTVQSLQPYAFWGCDSLRFVELGGSLNTIPGYAFSNCTGLEEITIPVSVKSIGSKAFADCSNLRKADIPASVTSIQPTAFDGCPQLSIAAEPGSYAASFEQTRDKSSVANAEYEDAIDRVDAEQGAGLEQSVQPEQGIAVEQSSQPEQSTSSEQSSQPENVAESEAVDPVVDTDGLATGNVAKNSVGDGQELGSTQIVAGRAFVFIDQRQHAYGNVAAPSDKANGQTKDAFPDSQIEDSALAQNGEYEPGMSVSANDGTTDDKAEKGGNFPKYTIVGPKIVNHAYYQDDSLQDYDIPADVTELGDFAFARTALKKMTIPDQITSIGYGAFYHCDQLAEVTIPASVQEIGPYAFEKTAWLDGWKNSGSVEDYKIVGDGILIAYKGQDGRVTVPEGVKQIAAGVFAGHKGITEVSLPSTLKIIGEEAFFGCSNLRNVSGGVAMTDIKDRAFSGCPIATIRIPESVERIGLGAYDQSTCGGAADTNAVVFLGSKLPRLSYEQTAERLSNESYRTDAFRGVEVAIVGEGMQDFTDTILDKEAKGFHGTIANLVQESTNGAAGTLHVISLTGLSGEEKVPVGVSIYQKPYLFDAVDGVQAETPVWMANSEDENGTVLVRTDGVGLTGHVSATLNGHDESYWLDVVESSQARDAILEAYRGLYGETAAPDMRGYDICLYDASEQIPITKLGKETIEITMPVPDEMDTDALHVVCTDEDGQLEEVPAKIDEQKGKTVVIFEAEHFSPYAIYHYENGQGAVVLQKKGGVLTSLTRKKDSSPDTGDWIHPKWFLAVGLLAMSMMMFFLKGNSKKTPGIM